MGDTVLSMLGWARGVPGDGRGLTKVDPTLAPVESYLGVMVPGMTAYFGLLDIGVSQPGRRPRPRAAGAVGSVVCQIAKLKGCRGGGSAGSEAKVAWLTETAMDAAFNYKTLPAAALAKPVPDGVDVYSDNVGGDHLEAVPSA
ncbi:MAG: hypothetical protein R3A10_15825 [Caldilineaceae bacterium]